MIVNKTSDVSQLRRLWRRWEHVVAHLSRGKGKFKPMSSENYHALHAELLIECELEIERADVRTRPVFQRIQAVVEPWISLESLTRAQKGILMDLHEQCEVADRLLNPRHNLWRSVAIGGVAAAAFVAGVAALQTSALSFENELGLSSLVADLRSFCLRMTFAIQRASFLTKFGALAVIIVLAAMGLLGSMRKY